jgi:hypothetical protein
MPKDFFIFSENERERIGKNLAAFENGRFNRTDPTERSAFRAPVETWQALVATGGISALSMATAGIVAGMGYAEFYYLSLATGGGLPTGSTGMPTGTMLLTDTGNSQLVYNLTSSSIASNTWVTLTRDPISGQYLTGVGGAATPTMCCLNIPTYINGCTTYYVGVSLPSSWVNLTGICPTGSMCGMPTGGMPTGG